MASFFWPTRVQKRYGKLDCVDSLVVNNHEFQDAFCSTPDAVMSMVAMYDKCTSRSLLLALTRAVCSATRGNSTAQKMFVAAGATDHISTMMSLKVGHQPVSSFPIHVLRTVMATRGESDVWGLLSGHRAPKLGTRHSPSETLADLRFCKAVF